MPVRVIAPLVERWAHTYRVTHYEDGGNGERSRYVDNPNTDGHLEVLGFHTGISPTTLRRIKNGKALGSGKDREKTYVDTISFDTADKIVCATLGPLAWHTEESLMPYYGPIRVTEGELKAGYELPEGYEFTTPQRRYLWTSARRQMEKAA